MNNAQKITLLDKNHQTYEVEILRHQNIYKSNKQITKFGHFSKNTNSNIYVEKKKNENLFYDKNKSNVNLHTIENKFNNTKSSKDEDDMRQNENYKIFISSILQENRKKEKSTYTYDINNYFINNKKENYSLPINNRRYYDNKFMYIRKFILEKGKSFEDRSLYNLNYSTKQTKTGSLKDIKNINKSYFTINRIPIRNYSNNYGKDKLFYSNEKPNFIIKNDLNIYSNFHNFNKNSNTIECAKVKSINLPRLKTLSNKLDELKLLKYNKEIKEYKKISYENIYFNKIFQTIKDKKRERIIFHSKIINNHSRNLKNDNHDYFDTFKKNNNNADSKEVISFNNQITEKNISISQPLALSENNNKDINITNENNCSNNPRNKKIPVYRV